MKNIKGNKFLFGAVALTLGMAAVSCEDQPDKFELTDGTPTLMYVRPATEAVSDSLLDGAFLDQIVCLVGNNLTSIHDLYFNDQKAVLNTSYITDNTMVVQVPGGIPDVVTNKIYMCTLGGDTVTYDFKVKVPAPSVRSMSNEWARPGDIATIYGDYFIDDPNVPLQVIFAGNVNVPRENITSISKTAISFKVPENYASGYMTVSSIYGSSRSAYQFHDSRNIIFDFDGSHGGLTGGHGWRNGMIHAPGDDANIPELDGSYIWFGGADISGDIGGTWAEDQFCMNYWPEPSAGYPTLSSMPAFASMLADYTPAELQMKFEVFVPDATPWSSAAMQIMFTPSSVVDYSTGTNAYYSDSTMPRGLWNPWQTTGSYSTGGSWQTISIPFTTFTLNHEGAAAGNPFDKTYFDGLTLFIWQGGVAGTDCSPTVAIDNIRIVPVE